jgi:hypothetical protein
LSAAVQDSWLTAFRHAMAGEELKRISNRNGGKTIELKK